MIKHIVMWKLKESAHGNSKERNAALIKQKLEALVGKIDGLVGMEVGIDFSCTANSGDVVAVVELLSKEALERYRVHPEHKTVVAFVTEAVTERRVVDYEV